MMILAAVLLVIGLIALAGMVARVNQLGSQTAVESNQAILGEVPPLADAIEAGVADLYEGRTVTASWVAGTSVIVDTEFLAADIGSAITGPGIPAGTRISGFDDALDQATLSAATTASGTNAQLRVGAFALWASSNPTLQDGIIAMLEHLQRVEAAHGFIMDYELSCVGGNPAQGIVIAHLSDGTVWAEVRTSAATYFARTPSVCTSVYG